MKNKILLIIMLICLVLSISSCNSCKESEKEDNDDNMLNGVDISKYEKPQTGFLHDGHQLTKLEEMMKYVIENGEFVFDLYSNGIGYKLILDESNSNSIYAFYCVDTLRIVNLKLDGRRYESIYVKLNDSTNYLELAYKKMYNSGYRQDFYAILNCDKQTFNHNATGTYSLYRGYMEDDEATVTSKIVSTIDLSLKAFNAKIKEHIKLSLKDINYNNY